MCHNAVLGEDILTWHHLRAWKSLSMSPIVYFKGEAIFLSILFFKNCNYISLRNSILHWCHIWANSIIFMNNFYLSACYFLFSCNFLSICNFAFKCVIVSLLPLCTKLTGFSLLPVFHIKMNSPMRAVTWPTHFHCSQISTIIPRT